MGDARREYDIDLRSASVVGSESHLWWGDLTPVLLSPSFTRLPVYPAPLALLARIERGTPTNLDQKCGSAHEIAGTISRAWPVTAILQRVAQFGRVAALGADGRRFESSHADRRVGHETELVKKPLSGKCVANHSPITGCSSVWPEYPIRIRVVGGSNPPIQM